MKKLSIAGALGAGLLMLASSFTEAAVVPIVYDALGNNEPTVSMGIDPTCISIECLIDTGQLQIPTLTFSGPYWSIEEPQTHWICACFQTGIGSIVNVVNETAVPIPAAMWLFGSSLLGLGAVARKRRC